jgi:hypothetical protein
MFEVHPVPAGGGSAAVAPAARASRNNGSRGGNGDRDVQRHHSKIESGKQVGCLVYVKLLTAMYGVDPRPGKADRTARGG